MTDGFHLAARLSLSFLWLFTAVTSAFLARDIGYQVLASGGITGTFADVCLYSGSLVDAAIGLWVLSGRKLKPCYLVQLMVIATYTLLLTIIDPGFWTHPFGPLTKNLPLLVLIGGLYAHTRE
ncbi:DoxX-like family protein [Marinobacter sp. CA1]|uniref:DoxX-like family protein n=1 Tax=Marinobacter sp. CA1 TaxID=2817656 RepID=UPI001D07D402|nr:DoxX-like family protein [Marinobacter sp. CA1]UDL05317.1 DoxX-like family protein [Marinobacter sp. CA1]